MSISNLPVRNVVRSSGACGALLAALVAWGAGAAAPRQLVAVHPLVVVEGTDKDVKEFQVLFDTAVGNLPILKADASAIRDFLGAKLLAGCDDDLCLREMAQAVRADKTLLVTVSPYSPKVIVTAKVVAADGRVLATPEGASFDLDKQVPKAKRRNEAVSRAFIEFLPTLGLEKAVPEAPPASTKVEVSTQAKVEPQGQGTKEAGTSGATDKTMPGDAPLKEPVEGQAKVKLAPAPETPAAGKSWLETTPPMRLAAYGLGVGGLACGATVGVLALVTLPDRAKLEKMLDSQRRVPADNPEAVALSRSLRMRSRVANGLLIGGGLLLVASSSLLFSPPPDEAPAQLSIAPVVGGAVVGASGRF